MNLVFAVIFSVSTLLAQTVDSSPRAEAAFTVSTLPTASSWTNKTALVTDGSAAGDCTTGSGSTRVLCVSSGTVWAAVAGGGGGSGTYTGYYFPFGQNTKDWASGQFYFSNGANNSIYRIFTAPAGTFTLNKIDFDVTTASGTACTGGTCGLLMAIYNSTCSAIVTNGTSNVLVSGSGLNINTTGFKYVTFSPAVTLTAGATYCLVITSDSTVLTFSASDDSTNWQVLANLNGSRSGYGTNNSSGNGSGLTPASTLGTLLPQTSATGNPPGVMFE